MIQLIRESEFNLIDKIEEEHSKRRENGTLNNYFDNSELDGISETVLKFFPQVLVGELKNKNRGRKYVVPRQVIMYLAVRQFDYPLMFTGNYFVRDHSTVIHAIDTIQGLYMSNKYFRLRFKEIYDEVMRVKQEEVCEQLSQ